MIESEKIVSSGNTSSDGNKQISLASLQSSLPLTRTKVILKPIKKTKRKSAKKNVEELLIHTANTYNKKLSSLTTVTNLDSNINNSYSVSPKHNNDEDVDGSISANDGDNSLQSSSPTSIMSPAFMQQFSLYISDDKLKQSFSKSLYTTHSFSSAVSGSSSIDSSSFDIDDILAETINEMTSYNRNRLLSSDDSYSGITGYTMSSRLTQRELLAQVTSRAWENKEPLSYIPRYSNSFLHDTS